MKSNSCRMAGGGPVTVRVHTDTQRSQNTSMSDELHAIPGMEDVRGRLWWHKQRLVAGEEEGAADDYVSPFPHHPLEATTAWSPSKEPPREKFSL